MSARDIVIDAISRVRADKGLEASNPADSDELEALGLDSLDMATVVAELQERLGQDPFADEVPEIRTVGGFAALYRDP